MARGGLVDRLARDAAEIDVPTQTPPVASGEHVACVHCGKTVARTETDLCGLGFRCRACSDKAELDELTGAKPDVSDHLAPEDRVRFAAHGKRLALKALGAGALLFAFGIVLLVFAPSPAAFKPMLMALIVVLAVGGHGYARWRRFRVR
jgi:hypothetical protein